MVFNSGIWSASAPFLTRFREDRPARLNPEEIILAMDSTSPAGRQRRPDPRPHTSQIARLSTLLKTLSAYPPEVQGEKYRNTHGVYLKLMNLRAVQTGGTHGMNRTSQADAAVWRDYIDNLDALHTEAEAIRQRLAEGVLAPAARPRPASKMSLSRLGTPRVHVQPVPANHGKPNAPKRRLSTATATTWQPKASPSAGRNTGPGRYGLCSATLWVQDWHALIEAKNSDSREALRMAIGQLYDYRRFHEPPVRLAVLLPHQPNPDGLTLLKSAGIEAIWPYGAGFRDSDNGAFV